VAISDDSIDPQTEHARQSLLARLRDPQPEDTALPAETDGYLRLNPDDAEVREARKRLPELDQSE
jgi:hypothetical protein